jgi:predicted ABC-type ATPase
MKRRPQAVIIAGPNGSGKSTLAPQLLREEFDIHIYVNADDIARELAGDDLQSAAMEAGRLVHVRLEQLREEKADFAIETTLAGRALKRTVDRLAHAGYDVHLIYLWQPSPDLAVARVRTRVLLGGHDVPEADIRRRILRSVGNFEHVYRRLVSFWRVYDARVLPGENGPRLIARGG